MIAHHDPLIERLMHRHGESHPHRHPNTAIDKTLSSRCRSPRFLRGSVTTISDLSRPDIRSEWTLFITRDGSSLAHLSDIATSGQSGIPQQTLKIMSARSRQADSRRVIAKQEFTSVCRPRCGRQARASFILCGACCPWFIPQNRKLNLATTDCTSGTTRFSW